MQTIAFHRAVRADGRRCGLALALLAGGCIEPYGDLGSITGGGTTIELTSGGGDPAASATSEVEPTGPGGPPVVCGDGVVGDGEACDDGDDEVNDGCDPTCAPTGAVAWSFEEHSAPEARDGATGVAIDGAGRIVVHGELGGQDLVLVLDPDGEEVWRRTFAGEGGGDVVVDVAGRIYAGGATGVIRCLSSAGAVVWTSEPPGVVSEFTGLALDTGALYSVGTENGAGHDALVLRRHDLATGAEVWTTRSPDDVEASGADVAVSGSTIVAVGMGGQKQPDGGVFPHPLVATFDAAGALLSFELEEVWGSWDTDASLGASGDLVLARGGWLRRVGPDLEPLWTRQLADGDGSDVSGVAVRSDGAILVAGNDTSDSWSALVRRHAGDGAVAWTSVFSSPLAVRVDAARAAAFGPGFAVAVGRETVSAGDPSITRLWVRRFAIE